MSFGFAQTAPPAVSPWATFLLIPLLTAIFVWALGLLTELWKGKLAHRQDKARAQIELEDQLKKLLNQERIAAITKFYTDFEALRTSVTGPFGSGVLGWFLPPNPPGFAENDPGLSMAKENFRLVADLDRQVRDNGLLLGKQIVLLWKKYEASIRVLAIQLHEPRKSVYVEWSLERLRAEMYEDLARAVESTVGLPQKSIATDSEMREAFEQGRSLGEKLLAQAEKDLTSQ